MLLASASAHAGTLTDANWFQVTEVGFPGVPMTRTFGQLGASGTSTATSIAVSLSYPQLTTQVIFPKTPNGLIDLAITVTQGGAQAITATPAMGSGTPGIPGTLIVMTAGHNAMPRTSRCSRSASTR